MPKPKAMTDYSRCHPEKCDAGVCAAVAECPLELLKQDAPWKAPYTLQDFCVGCGRCSIACPFKIIKLM